MATEFGTLAARRRIPFPPSVPFPERGRADADVLEEVRTLIAGDPWRVEGDFALAYAGPPHPIAARAASLASGSIFVEWVEDMYPAAFRMEKEAVSMMASLLGAPDGVGFLTTGGTELNITAVRLAREIAGAGRPEFILPTSGHFSFRLAAQLLGVRIRDLAVDEATMRPRVELLPRLVNRNTIGMACSAPEGAFGQLDPVEAFAEFASRRGLYLHVDAAFGGFILPFLPDLRGPVPPFDFSLPGVTSMSTDGHKLGLMPLTTGFFLVRDRELLAKIPSDVTMLHTITSTKPGGAAAAAWAVLRAQGRDGYRRTVASALQTMDVLAEGIGACPGCASCCRPRSQCSASRPTRSTWLRSTRDSGSAALGRRTGRSTGSRSSASRSARIGPSARRARSSGHCERRSALCRDERARRHDHDRHGASRAGVARVHAPARAPLPRPRPHPAAVRLPAPDRGR